MHLQASTGLTLGRVYFRSRVQGFGILPDGETALAVTPDGKRAVSGSDDMTLKFWDLGAGAELRTLEGHTGWVNTVAVTPDGKRAISGSFEIKVWDLTSGLLHATFGGESGLFSCCAVALDGLTIVAGDESGRVHLLRLENAGNESEK